MTRRRPGRNVIVSFIILIDTIDVAEISGDNLTLRGEILRPDGSEAFGGERRGATVDGADMGRDLAEDLLNQAGPGFFDWRG